MDIKAGWSLEFSIREKCLISFDSIGIDNAFYAVIV